MSSAKVTKAFPGRPDEETQVRNIAVGEVVHGELAAVAIREKWGDKIDVAANDELADRTVAELKALAEKHHISLGSARTKAEIIAVLRAAA